MPHSAGFESEEERERASVMEAYFHLFLAPSGCGAVDHVDGPEPEGLHGDFDQIFCTASKVSDGAIITGQDNRVTATGQIISYGESDPKDIQSAYLHFHKFGDSLKNGGEESYLLLPMMRSKVDGGRFVCPIESKRDTLSNMVDGEQSIVSVLAADHSNTVIIKELDYNDWKSEYASDCLWFAEKTAGALWRLYVTPEPKLKEKKLYMAADRNGRMFLTENEPLSIQKEGMENPATTFRLYLKYHADEA